MRISKRGLGIGVFGAIVGVLAMLAIRFVTYNPPIVHYQPTSQFLLMASASYLKVRSIIKK